MAVQTRIDINGTTVTSYVINYEYERVYGDAISQVDLRFARTLLGALTLVTGMRVEIWRGLVSATDLKVFDGYVESFDPEGGIVKIVAKDKLWDLLRRQVTKTYDYTIDPSAGKISEIFKDLVTTYGGLTADGTTIQDSGTTIVIQKYVCNHADVFDRCKRLAKALGWQFYYRADTDKVYFEPQGFTTNTNVLTVGSNVYGLPKWTYDNTEMVNDLTVVGAYQEVETTESGQIGVTSGYTTSSIGLNFTPLSVKLYADASNPPTTLKEGGVPDSSTDFYYYVDKPQKKLYPKNGTTFTTSDYAEIRYSYAVPIPINMYVQASIDAYGRSEKTITFTDIRTVADAEVRGQDYLDKYSQPFIYTTMKVASNTDIGLRVGQLIHVIDSISPKTVDTDLVVNRLRLRYPSDYDEIDVGDKAWRITEWYAEVEERLKRLQEEELQNEDLLVQIVTMNNKEVSPISFRPIYRQVLTQSITANKLIWGHPSSQGNWGSPNTWNNDGIGAEGNHFIMQFENTYDDSLTDTDFKDTGNTTATWSGNGDISFTAGQVAYSTAIDYNNGAITGATATFTGSGAGTPTYYLSANGGSNWEAVTSGAAYTFSNTGTDLRWRVDVAGGAYTLNAVYITGYH